MNDPRYPIRLGEPIPPLKPYRDDAAKIDSGGKFRDVARVSDILAVGFATLIDGTLQVEIVAPDRTVVARGQFSVEEAWHTQKNLATCLMLLPRPKEGV